MSSPEPSDLARFMFLLRWPAWRHVRDMYAGHPYLPFAVMSGAVADARAFFHPEPITPGLVTAIAASSNQAMLQDLFEAAGVADG